MVHVQKNKNYCSRAFQAHKFPGQYLVFSKQTNRLLVGVANALNGKNLPEGRIYYYTDCTELNIENRRDMSDIIRFCGEKLK